ncbi:alpha/beta hydrolase [Clostridium sp. B9]|uniref:alpha/beta hydrolase n=1 Tax=Clostridium sp. B9 TaxID=3423224 RepID=UPI003D2EE5C6
MYECKKEENKLKKELFIEFIKYNFLKDRNIDYKEFKYGDDKRAFYRVYKGYDKRKPTIFFIHSSGFWKGSPKGCAAIGKFFYKYGFNIVIPSYELAPEHKYPVQIENIFSAFKHYVDSNKPQKIVVMAYSAGAELAANLVYNEEMRSKFNIDNNIICSLITLAGTLDFSLCESKEYDSYINRYLYGKEQIFDVNPINLVKEDSPKIPVLCIHGNKDCIVNIENSKRFIEKINRLEGEGKLLEIEGVHHSDIQRLFIGLGTEKTGEVMRFINGY